MSRLDAPENLAMLGRVVVDLPDENKSMVEFNGRGQFGAERRDVWWDDDGDLKVGGTVTINCSEPDAQKKE